MHLPNREQEINLIIRDLASQFGERVTAERITAEARNAYDGLCATSKVEMFIPILAFRRARERVRLLAERVDEVAAAVEVLPASRTTRAGSFTVSRTRSA
jgi:hypothetical protein